MTFKCFRCGFCENRKDNLIRHLKRKKECEPLISSISREECIRILKTGEYKDGMEFLLLEMEKLKKSLNSLSNAGDRCINSVGNNNTNNMINITINSYEKTDYTVLKDKIHTCIKDGKVDEAKLIKLLHFNKDHPENHNVMIENKREKNIKVYNGTEFEDSCYKGREGIWQFTKQTIENTEETLEEVLDDDPDGITRNKKTQKLNEIEQQLYNGRKLVNSTHN